VSEKCTEKNWKDNMVVLNRVESLIF
jgi:hypothetical protein